MLSNPSDDLSPKKLLPKIDNTRLQVTAEGIPVVFKTILQNQSRLGLNC